MTDKERLEEMKNHLDRFMTSTNKPVLFREDAEWLIQQAECVKELEEQNQRYKQALQEIVQSSMTIKDYKEHSLHAEIVAYEALKGEPE